MQKIITLSGSPGTGKSFLGEKLANLLDWDFLSTGQFVRQIAKEKYNLNIYDFQKLCEENHDIDKEIDEFIVKKVKKMDKNVVLDYRLGYYFFPDSLKIMLVADDDEIIARLKERDKEFKNLSNEQISKKINFRKYNAQKRFIEIYGTYFLDVKNYDLIINNTHITPEEALQKIYNFAKKFFNAHT